MQARRLLPLALGVTVLLVLAGIASHGRPLSASRGSGPTATFFDYLFTSLVLFGCVAFVVFVYGLVTSRPDTTRARRGRWHVLSSMATLAVAVLAAALILHGRFEQRLKQLETRGNPAGTQPGTPKQVPPGARSARLRWDEVAIAAALLAGSAALAVATRRQRRLPRPWWNRSREAVSAALDFSLDDLRTEPDLRRAIIAAYARMERTLAGVGLPRTPSEAPFEYVDRALRSLDLSGASVARLTALFEWAKFSQHEPGPEMRDEAIDALAAVRDELRRPHEEQAA